MRGNNEKRIVDSAKNLQMRKSISTLLMILITGFVQAQSSFTKDQLEAQRTVTNLFSALSDRDAASLRSNCTTDVRFYEYGQIWSADTLINRAIIKNTAADFKRVNKLDFVNTTINGNAA
jgi:hypothetical protein